jgi:monoamine oxidase
MPRTRTFTLLRALAREAASNAARDVRPIDRRRFLAGLAGTAAAIAGARALPARASAPSVAIVGAGIAGMTAAMTLRDRGVTPVVFEASKRIGGRMHSETTLWGGAVSEYCGELIDSEHVTMRRLVRRFGLALGDLDAAEPPDATGVQFFGERYVSYATYQQAFPPVYAALREQLAAIGPVTPTYDRHNAAAVMFDRMTLHDWIERYVPGGHRSPLGAFLDVAYLGEYGRDTRKQSALNLILWLGIQPDPNNFAKMGPSDERYHIRGGNQRLPEAIAATLPPGTIEYGARLSAIRTLSDGRVGLTFDGRASERIFDHVIVTVPFSVLRGLDLSQAGFDARKRTAIAELGYGANAKLVVQFSHRFWNGRGAWPGVGDGDVETDLPLQQTWDTTAAQPGTKGLLTNYTGEAQRQFAPAAPYTTTRGTASVDGYARRFTGQLDRVVPGASAAYTGVAMLSMPLIDPHLLGAYSYWKPGQYTAFGGYERVRQGNVHFAGEHTSVHFQGFMEGGAATGIMAAHEVLA